MFSVYDLYDLHMLFVCIRSFPAADVNCDVISRTINVFDNRYISNEPNQFRIGLQTIERIKSFDIYDFVFTENKYCYYPLPFLCNEKIYTVLINSCKELQNAITENNIDRVYDLADCLHNLPIYIVENKYIVPRTFWKNEIKHYRKKWDKLFLLKEEKVN